MPPENELKVLIIVNEKGSVHRAQGNMTVGLIKLMIGELELIKLNLLHDLDKSLINKKE